MARRRGLWLCATGGAMIGLGLACSGSPSPGGAGATPIFSTNSAPGAAYGGVAWTQWSVRTGPYRWDLVYDDETATSGWLGDGPAPFTATSEAVSVPFDKGPLDLVRLDACHHGGRGPHPKQDGTQGLLYRLDRTWPACGPQSCTYGGLPFTTWSIQAAQYRWDMTVEDDGQAFSEWLDSEPVPYTLSGQTLTIPFDKGTVTLTQLDRCRFSGRGPSPKGEPTTLVYRLERVWPKCGCGG